MKNQHQIEEMHLNRQMKKFKNFTHLEYSPEDDLIICPWCYNPTLYSFSMPNRCNICSREITDADILNSYQD